MYVEKNRIGDKVIDILTIILIASFSVNKLNTYGSYILAGITLLTFVVFAWESDWKVDFKIGKMHFFVASFATFSLVSALWALQGYYAIEKGITIFEILICITIFYMVYSVREEPVYDILKVIMWGGYALTIYAFLMYGTDVILDVLYNSGRLNSQFDNVNNVGLICAITIVIAVFFAVNVRLNISIVMVIPTLLLLSACGSRKALGMAIVGVFLTFILKSINQHNWVSILKLFAVVIGLALGLKVLLSMQVFSGINERMDGLLALFTGKGKIDHSAWVREQYIKLGIQVFKEHPIIGVGMGNVRIINKQLLGDDCYLHNNFAELLADGGVIGFSSFYILYAYPIWRIIRKKIYNGKQAQIILLIIICTLVGDYGSVSYYAKETYFYFIAIYLFLDFVDKREEITDYDSRNDI